MSKSKGFTYFTTKSGQKLVYLGSSSITIGLLFGNFLPHTLLLQKYREFVQCYNNGVEKPVSNKILKRLQIAYEKLNLTPFEKKLIKPFTVYGFDLFQAGSTKHRFGAILGIPVNYDYDSVDDINKSNIRFRDQSINWDSKSGKLLEESLILTEDEQIFGFCKTILQMQTQRVLLNALYPSVSFIMVYTIGNYLNQKMQLFQRPFSLRLVMYNLLGLFGLGIWSFAKDFTQAYYDTDTDKKLCELGPEFIDAGIRYYDKTLKKNIALRELRGDNIYTSKGNENYFIRQKSLPLTVRKSYFEQRMKELTDQLNSNSSNPEISS